MEYVQVYVGRTYFVTGNIQSYSEVASPSWEERELSHLEYTHYILEQCVGRK